MKWLKYGAIGLVSLVALAVVVLVGLGFRPGAGETTVTVEVNKPPAEVWQWLEDKDKFKQWVSWTVDVKDEGPAGVGGKRRVTMRDPNMDNELVTIDTVTTAYRHPTHIRVEMSSPMGFQGYITYDLEDLGGRTRLTQFGHFTYSIWWAQLLEPLVTPSAKKKDEEDLATLKRLAEK